MKPLKVVYHYTTNEDYENYDTNAMVGDISRKCNTGDFYSDEEILSRQSVDTNDLSAVSRPTRKLKKRIQR